MLQSGRVAEISACAEPCNRQRHLFSGSKSSTFFVLQFSTLDIFTGVVMVPVNSVLPIYWSSRSEVLFGAQHPGTNWVSYQNSSSVAACSDFVSKLDQILLRYFDSIQIFHVTDITNFQGGLIDMSAKIKTLASVGTYLNNPTASEVCFKIQLVLFWTLWSYKHIFS